jgi:hypothetical protein
MFPAKAKRVIFLYMSGGVSHIDTFDPKPKLQASHLKSYNDEFLHASPWKFSRYAKCDTEVSELFPHVGSMMDDICVIRSMKNDIPNHIQAVMQIHGGSTVQARPSIGAWMSYGLGTVNQDLPSYMVLAPEIPYGGAGCWDSSVSARVPPGDSRDSGSGGDSEYHAGGFAGDPGDGPGHDQLLQSAQPCGA